MSPVALLHKHFTTNMATNKNGITYNTFMYLSALPRFVNGKQEQIKKHNRVFLNVVA
jgi:hypothetical protein